MEKKYPYLSEDGKTIYLAPGFQTETKEAWEAREQLPPPPESIYISPLTVEEIDALLDSPEQLPLETVIAIAEDVYEEMGIMPFEGTKLYDFWYATTKAYAEEHPFYKDRDAYDAFENIIRSGNFYVR